MPTLKSERFLFEIDSWKRILLFLMEESSLLKNELIRILEGNTAKKNLDIVDYYQNALFNEDKVLNMFRKDLTQQEKKITSLSQRNAAEKTTAIVSQQQKLRKDIELIERYFNKLKFEFIRFYVDLS